MQDQMFGSEDLSDEVITTPDGDLTSIQTVQLSWDDSTAQQLEADLQKRLSQEVVITANKNPWHTASLEIEGQAQAIKVRLRGDMRDNYLHGLEHASMRINLPKGKAFMGYRKFSLIRPFHENGMFGMAYYNFMASYGFIANDFHIVEVVLNGESNGYWILQEAFHENLYLSAGREKGIIFRFEDDCQELNGTFNPSGFPALDPYQGKQIEADSALLRQYKFAMRQLQKFKNNELPADSLFDLEQWATFIAVSDIFYAHHAMACHNTRLFYNPKTEKIEPIAWDPKTYQFLPYDSPLTFFSFYAEDYPIYKKLSQNKTFAKLYIETLRRLLTGKNVSNYVAELEPMANQIQPGLTEPMTPPRLHSRYFVNTENTLLDALSTKDPIYTEKKIDEPLIYVQNNSVIPLYIEKLTWDENGTEMEQVIDTILYRTLEIEWSHTAFPKYTIHYDIPGDEIFRTVVGY